MLQSKYNHFITNSFAQGRSNRQSFSFSHVKKALLSAGVACLALNSFGVNAGGPIPTGLSPDSIIPTGVIPEGGRIVGGSGSITQNGTTTHINQYSQLMAIDWDTFNLGSDGQVNFIQPGISSIALNRILDVNPSEIYGQINSTGTVILLNPYGVVFGESSSLNVGGLVASSLMIKPEDFMNGDLTFSELEGVQGNVINYGMINAATGGSVSLIGERVENHGVIAANLGSVNLAAGREAVLTFDNEGLLGVKVTESVLQDDLGVDPAVINTGEISAAGGQILLTATTSQDIFSQAVNVGDMNEADGVIVHEDGSFTLGATGISEEGLVVQPSNNPQQPSGDVINTGTLDVSVVEGDAGRIEIFGENVTSSGDILANSEEGNGGEVVLESNDTTELSEHSLISARAENGDQGGNVHVLGQRVGLTGFSIIDVSGNSGGGEVLVGGDFQGNNSDIQNSTITYVGNSSSIHADAIESGDGGKIILWSDVNTYFGGTVTARGGAQSGDGGFVETSGKENLLFRGYADTSAVNGENGTLLLDPRDINIGTNTADDDELNDGQDPGPNPAPGDWEILFGDGSGPSDNFSISVTRLIEVLATNDVLLQATEDINVNASISATAGNTNNLELQAGDDININAQIDMVGGDLILTSGVATCPNATCQPGADPDIDINGNINTTGMIIINSAEDVNINSAIGNNSAPSSLLVRAGENIILETTGSIITNGDINLTAGDATLASDGITIVADNPTGGYTAIKGDVTVNSGGFYSQSSGYFDGAWETDQFMSVTNGLVSITANGSFEIDFGDGYGELATGVLLGDISANALSVNSTNGRIYQYTTSDYSIDVATTSSFDASGSHISLLNSSNDFQGSVTFSNADDVLFNNAASATILGEVTGIAGSISVNATQNLTLANNITVAGNATFNFGQDNLNDRVFTTTGGTAINITGTLEVNGGNGNDQFIIANNIGGTLNGGDGDDTFNLNTDVLSTVINGGSAGTDTIVGSNSSNDNDWIVDSNGGGTLTNDVNLVTFSNIEDLTGGAGVDNFTITSTINNISTGDGTNSVTINDGGDVIGAVTGGSGDDTIILGDSGNASAGSIDAGEGSNSITVNSGSTIDGAIESGDGALDTIVISGTVNSIDAGNGTNNITINNTGDVTGAITGGTGIDTVEFNGGARAGSLSTGANDDVITIVDADSVDGLINGQGGSDSVTITGSGVSISLQTDINNVESIDAGAGTNTLTGDSSVSNTWVIDTLINGGNTVNDGTTTTSFTNFSILNAGNSGDSFTVNTSTATSGVTTINGGDLGDSLTLGSAGLVSDFNGGGGIDSIEILTGSNTWTIDSNNDGSVVNGSTTNFTSIETLITNLASNDTIDVSAFENATIFLANYQNFDAIQGHTTSNLQGIDDQQNDWIIDGGNSGNVTVASVTTNFSGFGGLIGGNDTDIFTITESGSFIGTIAGGAGDNSLVRTNTTGNNAWLLTGNDAGTLNVDTVFSQIQTLIGSSEVAVTDTLTGRGDFATSWLIDGSDTVTTNGNTINFSGMENLTGGANDDTFEIADGGSISGTINGGSGNNSLARSNSTGNNSWLLTGDDTGSVTYGATTTNFSLIQTLVGSSNGAVVDTLTGRGDFATSWLIDGSDTVTTNGNTINFSAMENLTGGTNNDSFEIADGGAVSGIISGGLGANSLELSNTSGNNNWLITGDDAGSVSYTITTLFNGIQTLIGSSNASVVDTLTGRSDFATDWSIDGTDTVTTNGNTINFSRMENLTGGANTDTFDISGIGTVAGLINGGDGSDSVTYTTDVDLVISLASDINFVEQVNVIGTGSNTLVGANAASNAWEVDGAGNLVFDQTTSTAFTGFSILNAGDAGDSFIINTSGITTINGGAGADIFSLNTAGLVSDIEAGGGDDTLNILSGDSTWSVNLGNNNGSVETTSLPTGTTDFTSIESFSGFAGGANNININSAADATILLANYQNFNSINWVSTFVGTLQGLNGFTNTWVITGEDVGTVEANSITTGFSGFDNITGGNQTDNFTLVDGARITGIIDGGGGNNRLTSNNTAANNWLLTALYSGELNGDVFNNIQTIVGNSANDTLTGINQDNDWQITDENDGSVRLQGATEFITFEGMENLTGNDGADNFTLADGARITGVIDGAGGANRLTSNNTGSNNWVLSALFNGTLNDDNFNNIQTIIGNSTNDTLTGLNQTNDWQITSENNGTVGLDGAGSAIAFEGMENLTGNAGADNFTLADGARITGIINGAAGTNRLTSNNAAANNWLLSALYNGTLNGDIFNSIQTIVGNSSNDTLTGLNQTNDWQITSENNGTVGLEGSISSIAFEGMENLTGNAGTDNFTLADGARISGLINGAGGANRLTSNNTAANSWVLTALHDGTLNNDSFNNIQTIVGNSSNDTLTGLNQTNDWQITTENDGTVGQDGAGTVVAFEGMENLTGNAGADNFTLADGARITGIINGAGGTNRLTSNNAASNSWILTALYNGELNGDVFNNIQTIVGNSSNDTLTGLNQNNDWQITSENEGSVGLDGAGSSIAFEGMENLTGNSGADNFTLADGARISGIINGAGGANRLTSNNSAANDWELTALYNGRLNNDVFNNIQTIVGNSTNDTLTGINQNNDWQVSGLNIGTVGEQGAGSFISFEGMENLTGNNAGDIFTIADLARISGIIDGGIGVNRLISNANGSNSWVLTGDNAGTLNGDVFTRINTLVGNSADDTLFAMDQDNNWQITSENNGTVGLDGSGSSTSFEGMENLTGNDGNDNFTLADGARITGLINGGNGINRLTSNNLAANVWLLTGLYAGTLNNDSFSGIQSLVGNSGNDTLIGINQANDWQITALDTGSVGEQGAGTSIAFTGMESLTGNAGVDIFTLSSAGSISVLIDGAGGDNELISNNTGPNDWLLTALYEGNVNGINFTDIQTITGNGNSDSLYAIDQANDWQITGTNSGTVGELGESTFIAFNGMENLNGEQDTDYFTLATAGSISGTINGGSGAGINRITSNSSGANSWVLSALYAGTLNGGIFNNIQELVGNSTNDTLTGVNQVNQWTINGENLGTVGLQGSSETLSFTGMENLNGGNLDDIFSFNDGGTVGRIDARDGEDTVEYLTSDPVTVTLANALNGVLNAEIVRGNGANSTIIGDNVNTTWIINALNGGEVGNLRFENFYQVVGGSANDIFILQDGGSIAGLIDGGLGDNSLQRTNTSGSNAWLINGANSGTVSYEYNSTNFEVVFENINQLIGSAGTDTLTGRDIANRWVVNGIGSGTVSADIESPTDLISFSGMEYLNGGANDDRFLLDGGSVAGGIDAGDHVDGDIIDYSFLDEVSINVGNALAAVTNAEIVQGNNTNSTLIGSNIANNWVINGENDGTVSGITFIDFNNLVGGSAVDVFTVETGGQITGVINGGTGAGIIDVLDLTGLLTDTSVAIDDYAEADFNILEIEQVQANNDASIANTLIGSDTVNTWNVDGVNAGILNTTQLSVAFTGFANLVGGAQNDIFNLNSADHITGLISGGGGTGDELNLLSLGRDIIVQLATIAGQSSFDTLYVNEIESIIANATQSNTLVGLNAASRWVIDGPNTSSVENIQSTETVSFSGFSILNGGTNDDSFEIIDASLITSINGGDGAGNDAIDYSNTTADVNIVIGSSLTPEGVEIAGIEGLIGNSSGSQSPFNSTITVLDGDNTWTIGDFDGAGIADGINDGLFQDADGNVISFIDFNNLQGGDGIDIFNIQNASSITGYINGGAGNDELRLAINGVGEVRFVGGLGEDSVLISGGGNDYDASYTSGVNGDEQLAYNSQSSGLYTLSFNDVEIIQDDVIATNFTINGSSASDTINISSGMVSVNNGTAVNFSNRTNLVLNGDATDVFDLVGDLNFAGGSVTLNNSSLTNSSNSLLTADSLIFNANADVGTESVRLRTNISTLTLTNVLGDIYLDEVNDIEFQAIVTSGRFDLLAGGNINQSSDTVLASDALFVLNSGGDINLTNQNLLQGSVDLTANSNVVFSNAVNTDFAGINTQNLTLDIQGDITDSGDIIVSGLASLSANGNDIVFDNATNDFNRIDVSNVNDLTLVDNGALTLNQINANGIFQVFANDLQASAAISAGTVVFNATGLVQLDADIESLIGDISISGASVNQSANLNSQAGIIMNSGDQITMSANSQSVAIGNINYSSENNLSLSLVNTQEGTVSLSSANGQILDINGELDNIIANRAELSAQNGIGALDALETQLSILHAQNGVGQLNINNRGTITLERLATVGDIEFNNTDLDGSDIYFVPGSVDAGYDVGALLMTTEGGSFLGVGDVPSFENADIVAREATFVDASFTGTFGSIARPLVLRVRDIATISVRTSFSPLFAAPLPEINDSASLFSFSSFDTISALAGGQLVEVESLVDVDPAIFTDLRNYNNDEIAVRLPNDQLYDYEEEEEEDDSELESESEELISVGTN